jgi:uncharacterized repeat protein (TIGR01451 family)
VSVSSAAPSEVTNTVSVSGGSDSNTANNSASDLTTIIRVADLTIQKSHSGGTFVHGETGRTYTITVGNSGSAPTSGLVTVIDTLPAGLTATAMSGSGWSCNVGTRTCTRNDALEGNAVYPTIVMTVTVNSTAPATVTNVATVSGGGDTNTSNNSASDPANVLTTPTGFLASAISTTQVSLIWTASVNQTNYQVLRSSNGGPFNVIAAPLLSNFLDTSLTPNTTYVYRVRAVDATTVGAMSNIDLATTMLFIDDPLVAASTPIKAVHITELRTAVNAVRAAAGLPAATFTDASLAVGESMKSVHLNELRTSLNEARVAIGLPAMAWTDPAVSAGSFIKAVHLRELRTGLK